MSRSPVAVLLLVVVVIAFAIMYLTNTDYGPSQFDISYSSSNSATSGGSLLYLLMELFLTYDKHLITSLNFP